MGRFVVPNESEVDYLAQTFRPGVFSLNFRLFKNAIVVDDATVIGDFTEADYSGYSLQNVDSITPTSADSYLGLTNPKGFTGTYSAIFPGNSGSDQTVYGVYITYLGADLAEHLLGAANVFDANPAVALDGKTISGPSDITAILYNLRLWDFITGNPALPALAHYILFFDADNYAIAVGVPTVLEIHIREANDFLNGGYSGTAAFTSTDGAAVLPSPLDFTGLNGKTTFTVTMNTTGNQTIIATDTVDGSILGRITVSVQS